MKERLALCVLGASALGSAVFLASRTPLFSANYLPHRFCYLAQPGLIWTNVAMDALIAISYVAIFTSLLWIAIRLRGVPTLHGYVWIFVSFGLFIVACAATHSMEIVTVWWPVYPLSAGFKVLCAAASVPTAILFARSVPELRRNALVQLQWLNAAENQRDVALTALQLSEDQLARMIRSEAELEAANRYLESFRRQLSEVFECTSDSIVSIDQNWSIVYGNSKAIRSLPDFQLGHSYWQCFPAIRGTAAEQQLLNAMNLRVESGYELFYEPYQTWFRARIFPSGTAGITAFFSDITHERKVEEELSHERLLREKRIEALSHMAGGLAHEISNPLAIIHARASDLKDSALNASAVPAEEVSQACDSIVNTADRAIKILRGLRGFAREAGNDPMEWGSVAEIVEQCIDLQQGRFERHHVELSIDIAPALPLLLCRETQIGQIVTNLLNNAFDAIDQHHCAVRWVRLSAKRLGETMELDVADSGPGIDEHSRAHLMEPFFTTKTRGLGMGVGLSLSRAIAVEHGGSLTLSDSPGPTCFRLILPLQHASATAATDRP